MNVKVFCPNLDSISCLPAGIILNINGFRYNIFRILPWKCYYNSLFFEHTRVYSMLKFENVMWNYENAFCYYYCWNLSKTFQYLPTKFIFKLINENIIYHHHMQPIQRPLQDKAHPIYHQKFGHFPLWYGKLLKSWPRKKHLKWFLITIL